MAHKTLIGDTAYEISGGKTLVNGTAYKIDKGRTLVGGTGYDISFSLPPGALNIWSSQNSMSTITCIAYGNGYWVVGGQRYDANGKCYACIAYATSPEGPWTTVDVWGGTNSNSKNIISCIMYANGYWAVGGTSFGGSYFCAHIGYATDPKGNWSSTTLWASDYNQVSINCVAYAGGYWVFGGCSFSTYKAASLAYMENLGGNWSRFDIGATYSEITSIAYADRWVIGVYYYSGSDRRARVYYATYHTGPWRAVELWSNSNGCGIGDVIYANGYWVAVGWMRDANNSYMRMAYTTNPSASWTIKDISIYQYVQNIPNNIIYENGYWVIACQNLALSGPAGSNACVAYAEGLNDAWKYRTAWSGNSNVSGNCICYGDGLFLLGGVDSKIDQNNSANTIYSARIAYAPTPQQLGDTE